MLTWFVVVTTEPAALHLCPVHAAPVSTEGHAGAHAHQQPSPNGEQAACTCVGDCSAGGFSVALSSAEQRFTAAPPRTSDGPGLEVELPRIPAPAFFLPYANGPPELRSLA